jgi:hypothetical protein
MNRCCGRPRQSRQDLPVNRTLPPEVESWTVVWWAVT